MRTEKIKDLFWFAPKSNIKAGDGLDVGRFPFYTSSPKQTKWINTEQHFDEALIFGTGGLPSIHFEDQPFSTSTDCLVAITTNKTINTKYVYYYLFGNMHLLERGFKGAGLKHISKKYIENLDIPVLPIETQNRVVTILDKAKSLVAKREESISIIDDLLRATFLEMFGDPKANPNKFPIRSLPEFYIDKKNGTKCGPFGSALRKEEYTELGVPVWNMDNISKDGKFNPVPNLYISKQKYKELESYSTNDNDIIISRAGTVGKMCVVKSEFANSIISTNLIRLRFNEELLPSYFVALMLYCKGGIGRLEKGGDGSFTHMSTGILDSLEFPYPELDLQLQFEAKQTHFAEVIVRLKKSLMELDTLLKSLVQKVFNGQLNFNVDFELDSLIREIDLLKKENDLSKITGDIAYLQRLIDKLNNQEFTEKDLYDKAKHAVFQLLEEKQMVKQLFDKKNEALKLSLI